MSETPEQRIIRDLTDRLAELEVKVDGALNAAYVNYDPLVSQLSELRREFAGLMATREVLADRDREWCKALILALGDVDSDGITYMSRVLARFNEFRDA